jgi:DNA repair exonuclease SbcCD ATPase subunit
MGREVLSVDAVDFMEQFHTDASPVERALAAAAREDALAEIGEQRAEAERAAVREDRAEALHFALREYGDPAGELQRQRAVCAAADDEVADLTARLERATRRRDRAAANVQQFVTRMAEATASVQRSAPSLDGIEGAAVRAQEVLREAAVERRVAAMLLRSVVRSVSPPKERSGPGCPVCSAARELERKRRENVPGREITRDGGYAVSVR